MNQMKTEKNGKTPCTENLNTYLLSGWSVHFMFAYGDVPDPFKMYHGEDCVQKFIKYTEHEVKWLYARFSQQQIKYLTEYCEHGGKHEGYYLCLQSWTKDLQT